LKQQVQVLFAVVIERNKGVSTKNVTGRLPNRLSVSFPTTSK